MHTSLRLLSLLAVVGVAWADLDLNLSDECEAALRQAYLNTSVSECLALNSLNSAFRNVDDDDSLLPAAYEWNKQLCAAPICDNTTLVETARSLIYGCSSYLGTNDMINQLLASRAPALVADAKNALCLRDSTANVTDTNTTGTCADNSQFCGLKLFRDLELFIGRPISLDLLEDVMDDDFNDNDGDDDDDDISVQQVEQTLASFFSNSTNLCTECNRALWQSLNATLVSTVGFPISIIALDDGRSLPEAVDAICGAGYAETPYSTSDVSRACPPLDPAPARLRRRTRRVTRWA